MPGVGSAPSCLTVWVGQRFSVLASHLVPDRPVAVMMNDVIGLANPLGRFLVIAVVVAGLLGVQPRE